MTRSKPPFDAPLDAAFAKARRTTPEVPDRLMQQVVSDALAELPRRKRMPFWRQIVGALGGWPAMAGLAATACVGVWVGVGVTDDTLLALSPLDFALLETAPGLGAFDLLLVDG